MSGYKAAAKHTPSTERDAPTALNAPIDLWACWLHKAVLLPLLQVRSFAGSGGDEDVTEVGGHAGAGADAGNDAASEAGSRCSAHTTSVTTLRGSAGEDKQSIKSFKDIRLTIGGLVGWAVGWLVGWWGTRMC